MQTMDEIRQDIDSIDSQIKELLMRRLDCSHRVAQVKQAAGSTEIYRADREQAMLERLGEGVPEDRRAPYLAVVRKVTETSRMYQYGLMFDWNEGLFDQIAGSELCNHPGERLTVRLTRPNRPNAMSAILCMVGDYGFDMDRMTLVEESTTLHTVTFDLAILGDVSQVQMQKLVFQLSKESADFRILCNEPRARQKLS